MYLISLIWVNFLYAIKTVVTGLLIHLNIPGKRLHHCTKELNTLASVHANQPLVGACKRAVHLGLVHAREQSISGWCMQESVHLGLVQARERPSRVGACKRAVHLGLVHARERSPSRVGASKRTSISGWCMQESSPSRVGACKRAVHLGLVHAREQSISGWYLHPVC